MKSYQDTLDWMFSKLPMYQKVGGSAYRPGLERILAMDTHLEHPHRTFKSIHVAGTNGKGSTSHILASVLQSAGYKVGLYTSPHLLDFRERIKVNGQLITEKKVIQFIERHAAYFESEQISFFEMTVGMAFDHFRDSQVDYAIVEVGLGGRLDATNVIMPVLSVITNIGLDHTEFLGTTRTQIAKEKAGFIKGGTPVVVGQKDEETQKVFEEIALQQSSKLTFVKVQDQDWETDLKGVYQVQNIQTALTALACLNDPKINLHTIKQGFKNVISNTGLLGRWQIIADSPQLILDVGHNKEGLSFLVTELQKLEWSPIHPDTISALTSLKAEINFERGIGEGINSDDSVFENLGLKSSSRSECLEKSDLLITNQPISAEEISSMKKGSTLIGMVSPFSNQELINACAANNINLVSMEFIPRITRAQKMDVLSSQANLAGYAAVIESAKHLSTALPMMMTAAGTLKPARVFVIGVGVAGLQAIATAKRLGARVDAFDTRDVVEEQEYGRRGFDCIRQLQQARV